MKKFLNVLFALSALGLIVACKPAGNGNTRLKHRVDPVDPEKPIWDDDPEEILTQKDFAWFATANNSILPDDFGFMGFCKKDGQLYVYYQDTLDQAYRPKNAKATWDNVLQRGINNADKNKNGWHKVIWNDNNQYTYKFTIPSINKVYEFKLDTTDKALKVYRNGKRESDFYKWYLDPKIPQITPEMKALMPSVDKVWVGPSILRDCCCSFVYDESTQKLYFGWDDTKKSVLSLLKSKNFSNSVYWQLVCPDPEGDPNVFYTMGSYWNVKFKVETDGSLSQVGFDYREGGEYYEDGTKRLRVFKGTIGKGSVNPSSMVKMSLE